VLLCCFAIAIVTVSLLLFLLQGVLFGIMDCNCVVVVVGVVVLAICNMYCLSHTNSTGDSITHWTRASDLCKDPQLFCDGVESGDVIQGSLGDCWLLGSMSVIATRNDLLFPLFVSSHPEQGFYQIKFFKNGAWQVVTIDDFLPVIIIGFGCGVVLLLLCVLLLVVAVCVVVVCCCVVVLRCVCYCCVVETIVWLV